MAAVNGRPLVDRVLVQPLEEQEVKKGGIIIPDTAKEKPQEGKVVALGTGKIDDNGKKVDFTVKKGDTIATILKEIGATSDEIAAIASALGPRGRPNGLKEGQKLRILVAATVASRLQPIRVIVMGDSAIDAVVALSDMGKYVSVDVASMNTLVSDASDDDEDDGKGIPEAERGSIFDRGARLDTGKPGTGLGLAIVRDVAQIYGGSIALEESEDLGGLLARLTLPLAG